MARFTRALLAVILSLTFVWFASPLPVLAQTGDDIEQQLAVVKHSIVTLQELGEQGLISQAEVDRGTQYYLDQASKAAGRPLTLEQVMASPDPVYTQGGSIFPTAWVIIIIISSILVVIACTYFIGLSIKNLLEMFQAIPYLVYETMFFAIGIILVVSGLFVESSLRNYIAFMGCLFFAAALAFTNDRRQIAMSGFRFSLILFIAWTAVALLYGSSLIGFISVAAFLAACGFGIALSPFADFIGFDDEVVVPRTTFAAFLTLGLFILLRAYNTHIPPLAIFESGAFFWGSIAGFLGLLTLSTKWYPAERDYFTYQILMIAACVAALFVGPYLQIPGLQKTGTIFLGIYIVIKFCEVPTRNKTGFMTKVLATGVVGLTLSYLGYLYL